MCTTGRRSRHLLGALAASALALAASPAHAETDLGPFVLSGELESGGKFITGDWGSSEFREYQDQRPGYFGRSRLLLEQPKNWFYMGFDYDYVGDQDQRYEGRIGQWGRWDIDLAYDVFPYTYGNDAKLFQDAAIIVWAVRRALIDGDGVLLSAVRGMACMEPPTTYMDHVGREIERTGSHPARYGVYFAEDGAKVAAVVDFLGLKHERSN